MPGRLIFLVLGLAAPLVRAHIVPVVPSSCSPEIALAVGSTQGAAAAAGPADALRVVYDSGASEAVFCPADPVVPQQLCVSAAPPRPFRLGAITGTLAFPPRFTAEMLASGDLTSPDVPLVFASGDQTATVPVTLTTGLVGFAGRAVQGSTIASAGAVTLVGVVLLGPEFPSLVGQEILLRLSCSLQPSPDPDQFHMPAHVSAVRGTITARRATVSALLTAADAPDLPGKPATLLISSGDVVIASTALPAGLRGSGKRFRGTSPDGQATLTLRGRGSGRYGLTAKLGAVTMPAVQGSRVPVDLTIGVGGLLARGGRTFTTNHAGRRLHAP